MTQKVLKQALEALEISASAVDGYYIPLGKNMIPEVEKAITSLRQAIAELESQNIKQVTVKDFVHMVEGREDLIGCPVYFAQWPNSNTHPPQRTWVGLAAEDRLTAKYMQDAPDGIESVIDYIESKLKEVNI